MIDSFGRTIEYMRISVTDRCNLRCRYCMPEEGIEKLPMSMILTYEEILRICRAAAELGIRDFRVTGGEPLVRRGCPDLIRELKKTRGIRNVTLTTNGQLLEHYADDLARAGLDGVNVSLDTLREDRYALITRGGSLQPVRAGIDRALQAGLKTKVNCLLQKDLNEDELENFARLAFDRGIDVRFIELMPVGCGDPRSGVSNETALKILRGKWSELLPDDRPHGSGPAVYCRVPGKEGAVGFISAVHGKFCGRCNRIRLTSTGQIRPCLCYEDTLDLKPALAEDSDEALKKTILKAVMSKPAGHSFGAEAPPDGSAMVQIGG